MTVQIVRGPVVGAPTPAGRDGELLDVAEVHEGLAWLEPQDVFTSWNCLDVNNIPEICVGDETPQKTFEGPTVVDGWRFAVYLGGQCKPLGADVESNIERVFDLRESRGVEKVFEAMILGSGTPVSGTPVSAAHALGLMENALGDAYAGVGTIHVSPLVATILIGDNLIYKEGGKFYTRLGTKVVVGSGYTSMNMYGTGDIQVFRGPRVLVEAPDTTNNVVNVLAERAYVVVGDCVSLKFVNIPPPAAQGTGVIPSPNPLDTGTVVLSGPGDSWTAPANLRSVTITVTNGSLVVDGSEVTAPHSVTFDADEGEYLSPPTVVANDAGDFGVVSWVVTT